MLNEPHIVIKHKIMGIPDNINMLFSMAYQDYFWSQVLEQNEPLIRRLAPEWLPKQIYHIILDLQHFSFTEEYTQEIRWVFFAKGRGGVVRMASPLLVYISNTPQYKNYSFRYVCVSVSLRPRTYDSGFLKVHWVGVRPLHSLLSH